MNAFRKRIKAGEAPAAIEPLSCVSRSSDRAVDSFFNYTRINEWLAGAVEARRGRLGFSLLRVSDLYVRTNRRVRCSRACRTRPSAHVASPVRGITNRRTGSE